ncbi:Uncharacterised protein [Streptococcus pneumoniae]|nr:Uncharacterised protein [Streptococcus pneumoniae]
MFCLLIIEFCSHNSIIRKWIPSSYIEIAINTVTFGNNSIIVNTDQNTIDNVIFLPICFRLF